MTPSESRGYAKFYGIYRVATLSGMPGIWEILPKTQENVRKIDEFLVMSGKC